MKYIIAPRSSVIGNGIIPASLSVIDGQVILNENELKFKFPDMALHDIVTMVDGFIVSRVSALDFINGRKSLTQIKTDRK